MIEPPQRHFDPSQYVTLFTDASYCPDTGAWGWAAWCKHGAPAETLRHHGGGFGCPGSHTAEVRGIEAGIAMVAAQVDIVGKTVIIQCDCKSALRQADLTPLWDLNPKAVRLKHVKGHQGTKNPRTAVNTWADRAAYQQMAVYRQAVETQTAD